MASRPMQNISAYEESTPMLEDAEELRRAAVERGYLFFRKLIPAADVLGLRREALEVTARHGFLRQGSDLMDGMVRDGANLSENDYEPEFIRYYRDLLRIRALYVMSHSEHVLRIIRQLVDRPILIHPRHLYHPMFPGRPDHTTHPHQDFGPVRGTPDTWTVWVPLGDCPAHLGGGLALVPGSHLGPLMDDVQESLGDDSELMNEWAWGEMATGDVLMFHGMTIHQARDNETRDHIRIATSFRYQAASDPVDEYSMKPHMRWMEWDAIYDTWGQDDPLKYYWSSLDLDVRPHWKTDSGATIKR